MKTTIILLCCLLPCATLAARADTASTSQTAASEGAATETAATETAATETTVLSNPLPGGRLLSAFGSRQAVLGSAKHHPGVDLAALEGVPVIAPADGTVMLATDPTERPGKGAMLILDHGPELKTFFNHMGELVVEVGQEVKRGDIVGYPRNAGDMAGPHIHFEVVYGGKQVDPADWIDELIERGAENQAIDSTGPGLTDS